MPRASHAQPQAQNATACSGRLQSSPRDGVWTRVSRLKSPPSGADTLGVPTSPCRLRAASLLRAFTPCPASATIGLVCASLYAAALGAGAFAQDEEATPAAHRRGDRDGHAAGAAGRDHRRARPRRSPRRSRPSSPPRPSPRRPPTPAADPTHEPTADAHAGARRRSPRRPRRRRPTPTRHGHAPALGVDKTRAASAASTPSRTARRRAGPATARGRRPRRDGRRQGLDLNLEGASRTTRSTSTARRRPRSATTPPPRPSQPNGIPTPANPGYSLATPGPAPIGVPNFFIEKFRIPPFLLPIYQAAGIQYGIRWEVLAAINEIETDYGRNLNISSAGALGWMQFMPADLGHVRRRRQRRRPEGSLQPGRRDLRRRALPPRRRRRQGPLPRDLRLQPRRLVRRVGADARPRHRRPPGRPRRLAHRASRRAASRSRRRRPTPARCPTPSARSASSRARTPPTSSSPTARAASIRIFSRKGAPVVAVNDGKIIRIGRNRKHGRFVELQDTYGNTYLYAGLGEVAETYPSRRSARPASATSRCPRPASPRAAPPRASTQGRPRRPARRAPRTRPRRPSRSSSASPPSGDAARAALPAKERLFAHPERPNAKAAGGDDQLGRARPTSRWSRRPQPRPQGLRRQAAASKGARIVGGTVLGRMGEPERRRSRRTCASRSARPAAARRASTRSRSSTAGSCSSRRRSTARPSATRSSAPTPRRPRSARSC